MFEPINGVPWIQSRYKTHMPTLFGEFQNHLIGYLVYICRCEPGNHQAGLKGLEERLMGPDILLKVGINILGDKHLINWRRERDSNPR